MASQKLLSIKEIAARCGVTPKTLYQWRRKKYGPPFVQLGGKVGYLADEFDPWFDSQKGPK